MSQIHAIFVKRPWWHPGGFFIRWALPVTRFRVARAGHAMVYDPQTHTCIHAKMLRGVVSEPFDVATKGYVIVASRAYSVPDAKAGMDFVRAQIGKPYDNTGAMGITVERDWQEDDAWFCFELVAAALHAAGREIFTRIGHVTDTHLLMIKD
jgi:uncharacterized protein YycO